MSRGQTDAPEHTGAVHNGNGRGSRTVEPMGADPAVWLLLSSKERKSSSWACPERSGPLLGCKVFYPVLGRKVFYPDRVRR